MRKLSEEIVFDGEWLQTKRKVFENQGKEFVWESIVRKKTRIIALVIAKLIPSGKYILIRQYRPARESYVIGFPAGLVEEDIRSCALRELKEETGYEGKIISVSPSLAMNAGISNENVHIVTAEVDENQQPKQELEYTEDIEVIEIEESKIKDFLLSEIEKGVAIGAGVWSYFISSKDF